MIFAKKETQNERHYPFVIKQLSRLLIIVYEKFHDKNTYDFSIRKMFYYLVREMKYLLDVRNQYIPACMKHERKE